MALEEGTMDLLKIKVATSNLTMETQVLTETDL